MTYSSEVALGGDETTAGGRVSKGVRASCLKVTGALARVARARRVGQGKAIIDVGTSIGSEIEHFLLGDLPDGFV